MSVFIPIPITELEVDAESPSKTYKLDIERGRIFPLGTCDGLEAVSQFIRKVLLTPRFHCLIYDSNYGSELKQTAIATDVTNEYIESEVPRMIKDACLYDSRILDIYDFAYSFDKEKVHIKFKANTIYGETVIEEVV